MFGLIGIIGVIVLVYAAWQRCELKKFRVTRYEMESKKIKKELTFAVISDLHSFSYGADNERLVQAVLAERPDLVLVPGDLIVTAVTNKYAVALALIRRLCDAGIPVVCSNGNHESRAGLLDFADRAVFLQYCRQLNEAGAVFLNNECRMQKIRGETVRICGLELPLYSYKKGRKPYLEEGFLTSCLGSASDRHLQILLAHHPAFADRYAAWGADLTVCGHNHGGLVCIPGIGSVVSPQFLPFPEYDAGEFTIDGRKVFISRGLGTHTFHIRVFNRAELLVIKAKPAREPDRQP